MKNNSVVAVFGLSGVGKSWLIGRFVKRCPVLHVQASQLMRDAKAALSGLNITSEQLRTGAVLDNQALLVQAFSDVRAMANQPIIFDGHCVVDNGVELLEIPVEVIDRLSVNSIVFIEGLPKEIVDRRRNDPTRVRPNRSEIEIYTHQQKAKEVCELYSKRLNVPLVIVSAGDEDMFAKTLSSGLLLPAKSPHDATELSSNPPDHGDCPP